MLVTLDGQRLDGAFDGDQTLATLVHSIRNRYLNGRLVVGVSLNGESLFNEALQNRLDARLSADDQVDLESGERGEVVQAALRDAARDIGEAVAEHRAVADTLNTGRTTEALEALKSLVAIWQACQRVIVEGGSLLGRDLSTCEYEGRSVEGYLRALAEKLRSLRDVLDAHDMVSLADLACYELPPLCETWRGLLESLADSVRGTDPAARPVATHA